MVRSSGFGSITRDKRPIQARFHYGFSILCFNLPLPISRRLILQQERSQTFIVVLLLLVSLWFHVLFTPLPGFFSPFPHGTISLSVIQEYLALRGGPRGFTRNFTCSMLLGIQSDCFNFQIRDYHSLWLSIPNLFF